MQKSNFNSEPKLKLVIVYYLGFIYYKNVVDVILLSRIIYAKFDERQTGGFDLLTQFEGDNPEF